MGSRKECSGGDESINRFTKGVNRARNTTVQIYSLVLVEIKQV